MTVSPTPDNTQQTIPFKNVDAQGVPPCGVMQVVGSVVEDGVAFLTCARVSSTLGTQYAVNGLVRVPPGAKGVCYRQGDLPVAFDAGVPQVGQNWGVRANQWTLSYGYPALVTVHGVRSAAGGVLHGKVADPSSVMGACADTLPPLFAGVPGSGTIVVRVWNGSSFVPAQPAMQFAGYNASTASIKANTLVQFVASNGLWVVASAAEPSETWHATAVDQILPGEAGTVQLEGDMSQVEAYNWSDEVGDLGIHIEIGDRIHVYRDPLEPDDDPEDPPYYAIKVPRVPRWFTASLTGTLNSTDTTTENVDSIIALDGAQAGPVPTDPTLRNDYGLAALNGSAILFVEDLSSTPTEYLITQVKHAEITVDVDVAVDDAGDPTKIEHTQRTIVGMFAIDDSAASDVVVFETETVVTDSLVDSTSDPTELQKKTKSITVLPNTSTPSTIQVVAIETETVVTDSLVDSATTPTELQKKTKTLRVWTSTSTESAASGVIDIEECP